MFLMARLLTEVDNVCYCVNRGKEENGPSYEFVKFNALIQRKEKGEPS